MPSIREVVKSTLLILKSNEKPVGWPSTHADGSVWRKVKPSGEKGAWAMIKAPSKSRASKLIAETVKNTELPTKISNNNEAPLIEEKKFNRSSKKILKTKKQTPPKEPSLFDIAPQTVKKFVNQNFKPSYFPESIKSLEDLILQVKNSLINAGLNNRAIEFESLAKNEGNNLNNLLNISYKFVSITSENVNKIIRSLISTKVHESKRSLSEAMLGNDNAAGKHDREKTSNSTLAANTLSEVVSQLQDSNLTLEESDFIERLKESVEKKQIAPTISAKINDALANLVQKEPSIVIKIIRNYISESLLKYNEKNKPKPIEDDTPVKRKVVSTKFRNLADAMEESIRNKENPPISRQNPTYRRARIADYMSEDAKKLRDIQSALRGIAEDVDLGTLPESLKNIKSKKDIEQILNVSKSLDNYRIQRHTEDQKPLSERISVWFRKLDYRFISEKSTDRVSVSSSNKIYRHNLTWANKNGLISKSELEEASKVQKSITSKEAEFIDTVILDEAEHLKRLMDKINKIEQCLYARPAKSNIKNPVIIEGKPYELYFKGNPYSNYNESALAIMRLGLNTYEQVHEAGQYLRKLIAKNKAGGPDPKKIEIRSLERELIGNKIPGFFPTPKPLAQRLILEADIKPGMDVLEPSAGKGDLAETISEETGIQPDTIEPVYSLKNILQAKGYTVVADDFLDFVDKRYDRILMNPPFENGNDIRHVKHAYSLLKPGGKLVAIMSEGPFFRGDSKSQDFREWLTDKGGVSEKLPEGSFKGKDSFRQTGVSTRIVTLTKHSDDILYEKNLDEGISRSFLDSYQPELNVSNRGIASNSKDWTLRFPVDGDKLGDWPVLFKTKTEAIDHGKRSKRLYQEYFSEPEEYEKIVKPADPNSRSRSMKGNQNAKGIHVKNEIAESKEKILPQSTNLKKDSYEEKIREIMKLAKNEITRDHVQPLLDVREKNKEFKDTNERIPGSKKELAALSKILSLNEIDKLDPVTSERIVKKERVLPPFDFKIYKDRGEESGLVYLKSKLYESIASKPADSEYARRVYVQSLNKLITPVLNAQSFDEIEDYAYSFYEISTYSQFGKLTTELTSLFREVSHPNFNSNSIEELRSKYKDRIASIVPGSEVLVDKILSGTLKDIGPIRKEANSFIKKSAFQSKKDPELMVYGSVFGDKLFNMLHKRSETGLNAWNQARLYNSLTEKEATSRYVKFLNQFEIRNKELIADFQKKYPTFEKFFKDNYRNDPEQKIRAETKYKELLTPKSPPSREKWAEDPKNRIRDSDWSWTEKTKKDIPTTVKNKTPRRSPLDVIIRQNGRAIHENEISSEGLTQFWGFKSVQFGNYMDDVSSRDHITRFVSALKDLEDALEIDIHKTVEKSGLSMAFGARGTPGQTAHYEPGYKIINITKTQGDGSIAHEFGHFLDQFATGLGYSRNYEYFISSGTEGPLAKEARKLLEVMKVNPDGRNTSFYSKAVQTGVKELSKSYELFARAFESYVEDKLSNKKMMNNYLVSPTSVDDLDSVPMDQYQLIMFPQGEERVRINLAFEEFMNALKKEKDVEKPFDSSSPRISSIKENYLTISDIVKKAKK
ncbi:LPD1 domain-containing protein [Leptospira stimsonii]|uniref:Class I SAM-dependent methyltransferase n=1 Tax=Leptospira stimsonii TaxID=2202203 RepID=A0A8B3CME6_9LEPT|nr:LPD1 domain-containing protein [Leptospira stimsonii]RHX83243.1 class I SAM-dependent methyltransferase [Leptospira stimsonii]